MDTLKNKPFARSSPSAARPIHQGGVTACAFLGGPDALATGSVEGAVVIWDVAAGAPSGRIEAHIGPVPALAWDARRRRLISCGHDRRIVIADPATGAILQALDAGAGGVFSLAISPDGETLASGGYDRLIRLWRLADGALLGQLAGHSRGITDLDFLDDARLASCGRDDQVIVWDLAARAERVRTGGHRRWAMRVRASADGRQVFSAGEDGLVCCWAADTGALIWRRAFVSPVWGLERTPDGQALIVGRGGGVLRLDIGPDGPGEASDVAPETARAMARCDAGLMAFGADTVVLYRPGAPGAPLRRLQTGAVLTSAVAAIRQPTKIAAAPPQFAAVITRHHGEVDLDLAGRRKAIQPSHDGLAFAACAVGAGLFATSGFDGRIRLRRAADGAHVRSLDHGGFIFSVSASSDGRRLLAAGNDRVSFWDVASGERLWAGKKLGIGFHCWATLSADGAFALAVGEDQGLHRWTFSSGEPAYERLALDTDPVIGTCGLMGVAILDEGAVAIGGAAGDVRRADLRTGRTELLHDVHESGVRALARSPDGRRLLSFSENGLAAVYNLTAGRLCTPAAMTGTPVPAACFTSDGDLVWVDGEEVLHALSAEALAE